MNYKIFLGGSVCDINEDIYINLENGNNNFQNFNFNSQLFEYIKNNISRNLEENISFIFLLSNLGEDTLNKFELYSTDFFDEDININQLVSDLGNIITVKENKYIEKLTVLLIKDNNIFNIVHLYNHFDWVKGLDIGFFNNIYR